ncbi:MAG: hypothetical protein AAF357_01180 [Verrucomicrobiota bacterium]
MTVTLRADEPDNSAIGKGEAESLRESARLPSAMLNWIEKTLRESMTDSCVHQKKSTASQMRNKLVTY